MRRLDADRGATPVITVVSIRHHKVHRVRTPAKKDADERVPVLILHRGRCGEEKLAQKSSAGEEGHGEGSRRSEPWDFGNLGWDARLLILNF